MTPHIDDLLPFYLNQTLTDEVFASVESHLDACPRCRALLDEWQGLAAAARRDAARLSKPVPSLSPVVRANLKRRASLPQAALSTAGLIWAQRIFLFHGLILPILSVVILLGILASLAGVIQDTVWAVLPLFALLPILAAVSAAFLNNPDGDPAYEIVLATPVSPGTLAFARLSLALTAIMLLSLLGCLLCSLVGRQSFLDLAAGWVGPLLCLSGLTTFLSILWRPSVAIAVSMAAWGGLVILLAGEAGGNPLIAISLLPLLHPGWALLAGQLILAGLLWLASWLWLATKTPGSQHLERGL
jgi:hypothetical protein